VQDRTNLGNARVAGLQQDLNMTNTQYSISLTVTYVPYIVAELPSNLMLKVRVEAFFLMQRHIDIRTHTRTRVHQAVGPNLMLPTLMTLWGIVATLQGTSMVVIFVVQGRGSFFF